jgi:hypothetical protein
MKTTKPHGAAVGFLFAILVFCSSIGQKGNKKGLGA